MDFLLLGPFEARAEGRRISLGRHRERCLLAVLLLEANRLVSTDRLVSLLWSGEPPARARRSVQVHVSRLRGLLGRYPTAPRLVSERVGYLVEAQAESIDAFRFRAMVQRAGMAGDPADRSELFRGALDLWRGPLLADMPGLALPKQLEHSLDELRCQALEGWFGAELDRGRHREVLPDLAGAVAANPEHEGLVALHQLALRRSGRTAVAGQGRRGTNSVHGPREANPSLLPEPSPGFVGRAGELAALDDLVRRSPSLGVISGAGGVGKTALALHWAHASVSAFPEGAIYVDLDGRCGEPVPPEETSRLVLERLGLPDDRIPDDARVRADLYRQTVTGRRLLILDNVQEAAHVREALPADPNVVVLAVSRYALPGLAVHEQARQIRLEPLAIADAVRLLGVRGEAGEELARRCGRMPLALRLVRSAVAEPDDSKEAGPDDYEEAGSDDNQQAGPDDYEEAGSDDSEDAVSDDSEEAVSDDSEEAVSDDNQQAGPDDYEEAGSDDGKEAGPEDNEQVRPEDDNGEKRWAAWEVDEEEAGVRDSFDVSYRRLGPQAARALRILATLPVASVGIDCAASACELSQADARRTLETLSGRELIFADPSGGGGYRMHELVRLYALDRAHAEEPPAWLDAALRRTAEWYNGTALHAQSLLDSPASTRTQKKWFEAERENLAAMIGALARKGWHSVAARLAAALSEFYHQCRLWREWVEVNTCASESARLEGDWQTRTRLLVGLGVAHRQLGRFEQSADAYLRALDIASGAGDELAIGPILADLGGLCLAFGRVDQARRHLDAALAVPGYAGDPRRAPVLWLNLTHLHFNAGDLGRAAESLHRGLALASACGDARTMAHLHHWAGELALRQRCFDAAAGSAAAELEIARSLGDPLRQACALDLLASATAHRQGDRARSHWLEAQALCDELGHPLGADIAETLRAGGQAPPERRVRVNLLYA